MNKLIYLILIATLFIFNSCQNSGSTHKDPNSISHVPKKSIDSANRINDLAKARNAEVKDQMDQLFDDEDN